MKRSMGIMMGVLAALAFAVMAAADDMDKGSMMEEQGSMPAVMEEHKAMEDMGAVDESGMKKSDSSDWGVNPFAKAVITGTDPESTLQGTVDFVETGGGVQVVAKLSNVIPAGKHGFHVHENGSCEDMGKAAGGHFNPASVQHGLLPKDGATMAHSGDMGNIEIDANGNGNLVIYMPGLSLTKDGTNIVGKAVIVHEKEDDFSQPTGNAGGRIGCGIIELSK